VEEVPFWQDRLAGTARAFEADLEVRGFVREDDGWLRGPIPAQSATGLVGEPFRIALPSTFPFSPPVVAFPSPPDVLTWHLSPGGHLCLFRSSNDPDRPWETVDGLFERVADWVNQNAIGWPDDPGDPDLHRYFDRHIEYLVSYNSGEHATGPLIRTERNGNEWIHLSPSQENRKARRKDSGMWFHGVDLGLLEHPIWNWSTLVKALPDDDREDIRALGTSSKGILLVHYARNGTEGTRNAAIALFIQPPAPVKAKHSGRVTTPPTLAPDAESSVTALEITDESLDARWFRAGPDAERMKCKHVGVIGCGAVGSFTVDLLARSGIGEFTLIDPERLVPGNCVRHLADLRHVPRHKVDAVRDILVERDLVAPERIHTVAEHLTAQTAINLLMNSDLVVDATANAAVGGLLRDLAHQVGNVTFLKVALHREGAMVRVDRFGVGTSDMDQRPPFIGALPTDGPVFREAGCGDPVSSTPPASVLHAASMACRAAIDTMRPTNQRTLPDSLVEVLAAQPDAPWDRAGLIS